VSIDVATAHVLLALARNSIAAALGGPSGPPAGDDPILHQRRGVFVTLTRAGRLRGCIGRVEPDAPLSTTLPDVAVLAATGDSRFPPVKPAELDALQIEISLLTVPVRLADPAAIEIGRHGVIIEGRGQRGLLLPQVATEYGWNGSEFLDQVCVKASLAPAAWRSQDVELFTFETEIVAEGD
jgi:AmmeMemoRadiSam system protein A